jgi:hypothetical protein
MRGNPAAWAIRSGELRSKRFDRAPEHRGQSFDDVARTRDETRALPEQVIGARRARIERASRHGKHLTALLTGLNVRLLPPLRRQAEMPEIKRLRQGKSLPRGAKPGLLSLRSKWPGSDFPCANPFLLASQQASDVIGVAPIEQNGEHQDEDRHARFTEEKKQTGDSGARHERRKR